jgi:flap endonuclease-1
MLKLERRTVRATKEQTEECKKLLDLMGVPTVQAVGEAEATCAEMVKKGKCWATGTEDMDALTFGTSRQLRHLSVSEAKKQPIHEIHLDRVLEGFGMDMDQFIDLCILLGCDYCPRIPGIGPQKAFDGILKHKTINAFLATLDKTKFKIPEDYPFEEARALFKNPEITVSDECNVTYKDPDEEGLMKFLCEEKMFARDRVEKGLKKLVESKERKTQGRLDSFFTVQPKAPGDLKRKAVDVKLPPGKKPVLGKKAIGGKKK